jgi:predicted metal-dependent HD superfamily phosphohydrolase
MNWPDQDRWMALCRSVGVNKPESGWYDRLTKAHAEPQRFYHNQQHIAECLAEFDQARELAMDPTAVEFALWFHDAVYDPKAGDNEEQSAALSKECLNSLGANHKFSEHVAFLIMATKSHEVGISIDAAVMVDVDLSILGRDTKRFFEYEEQIRKEYQWVPQLVFASKRAEILKRFLSRERIFATDWFRNKYEKQARLNLEASIAVLSRIAP